MNTPGLKSATYRWTLVLSCMLPCIVQTNPTGRTRNIFVGSHPVAHTRPHHTYGYFLQAFKAPAAVKSVLEQLRAVEPTAPIFLVSDAGLDFRPMAAHFRTHYLFDPVSQAHDHTEKCNNSMPLVCEPSRSKQTHGNYGNPLRYLGRIGDAMRACECTVAVAARANVDAVCMNENAEPSSNPDKAKARLLHVKADLAVAIAGKDLNSAWCSAPSGRLLSALSRNCQRGHRLSIS